MFHCPPASSLRGRADSCDHGADRTKPGERAPARPAARVRASLMTAAHTLTHTQPVPPAPPPAPSHAYSPPHPPPKVPDGLTHLRSPDAARTYSTLTARGMDWAWKEDETWKRNVER